jgi:hypothetical protein
MVDIMLYFLIGDVVGLMYVVCFFLRFFEGFLTIMYRSIVYLCLLLYL